MAEKSVSPAEVIAGLDDLILAAVPGQESQIAGWLEARQSAVAKLVLDPPSIALVADTHRRTRRIEEKLLHWRRSAIMELSLIENHLRFVTEQCPSADVPRSLRVDLTG